MKKSADGSLTIYSVGEDGIDNGGDVEVKDGKRGADVGIVLAKSGKTFRRHSNHSISPGQK